MSQSLSLHKSFFGPDLDLPKSFLDICKKEQELIDQRSPSISKDHPLPASTSYLIQREWEERASFQEILDRKIECYKKSIQLGGGLWFKKTFVKILTLAQLILGVLFPIMWMTLSPWVTFGITLSAMPFFFLLQPHFDAQLKERKEGFEAAQILSRFLKSHSYKNIHPKGEWDISKQVALRSDRFGFGRSIESTQHAIDVVESYDLDVSILMRTQCAAQLAMVPNAFSKESWIEAIHTRNLEEIKYFIFSSSNSFMDQFYLKDPELVVNLNQGADHYLQEMGRKFGLINSLVSGRSGLDALYREMESICKDFPSVEKPDSIDLLYRSLQEDLSQLNDKLNLVGERWKHCKTESDLFTLALRCHNDNLSSQMDALWLQCQKMHKELYQWNHPLKIEKPKPEIGEVKALKIDEMLKTIDQKMVNCNKARKALQPLVLAIFLVAQVYFSHYYIANALLTLAPFALLSTPLLILPFLDAYLRKREGEKKILRMERHLLSEELKPFEMLKISGDHSEALHLQKLALEMGLDGVERTAARFMDEGFVFRFDRSLDQTTEKKLKDISTQKLDFTIDLLGWTPPNIQRNPNAENYESLVKLAQVADAELESAAEKLRILIARIFKLERIVKNYHRTQKIIDKNRLAIQECELSRSSKEETEFDYLYFKQCASLKKYEDRLNWLQFHFGPRERIEKIAKQLREEINPLISRRDEILEKLKIIQQEIEVSFSVKGKDHIE